MHRTIVLAGLLIALVFAAPSSAHTPFLGEAEFVLSLPGEANITSAASNAQGGAVVSLFEHLLGRNARALAIRRPDGTWTTVEVDALGAQAVIPVALEDGRFLVLWDRGSTIRAQAFAADGTPSAATTILSAVTTVISGDSDHAGWSVRSNLAGSVVVAAGAEPGGGAAVVAVRDPGGDVAPQQVLGLAEPGASQPRAVMIGPIAADGAVTVGWSAGPLGGTAGRATRADVGQAFGAPAVGAADLPPSGIWPPLQTGTTLVTDQSEVLELDPALVKRCPCINVRRVRNRSGRIAATLALLGTWRTRAWFELRRRTNGTWGLPRRVSGEVGAVPIDLGLRGAVGFVRATSDTDYGLFRFASRLFVVPYGFPTDARAPTVRLGPILDVHRRSLLVPVWCDEPCRITSLTIGDRPAAVSVRDAASRPRSRDLEPHEVAWLRVARVPGVMSVSVAVTARDLVGKRDRVEARFRSGSQSRQWCRADIRDAVHGCR